MNDWDIFVEAVPWFLERDATVEISHTRKGYALSQSAVQLFPPLATLLADASVTSVAINGASYCLMAWSGRGAERMGWLSVPGSADPPRSLFAEHRELLASFGGVVERFNEPQETWLLNQNDVLTEREASHDGSFIKDYSWAFEKAGLTIPIDPTEYYSIAREANGNTTLCHRSSGELLMFAADHCFRHLERLEGCPEYTLYQIKGARIFQDWVNTIALQWLAHTESKANR
jgi:hypothetical protein